MAIDARTLTTPIICTLEEIEPIAEMSQRDNSKAAAALRALAEHNNTARQRAVSGLISMTGNARAIRNREAKTNDNGGR